LGWNQKKRNGYLSPSAPGIGHSRYSGWVIIRTVIDAVNFHSTFQARRAIYEAPYRDGEAESSEKGGDTTPDI
jgi:hypothetical protein